MVDRRKVTKSDVRLLREGIDSYVKNALTNLADGRTEVSLHRGSLIDLPRRHAEWGDEIDLGTALELLRQAGEDI